MNASDIIKMKQNGTLYKAYYNPAVFQSTTISTIIPFSSSETTSYTSTVNTEYQYECLPSFLSYQLVNDVNEGKYVCGGKTISELSWKAISTMNTEIIYAFSTYSTPSSIVGASTINSLNSRAIRPLICNEPIYFQQPNSDNCSVVCENIIDSISVLCNGCNMEY